MFYQRSIKSVFLCKSYHLMEGSSWILLLYVFKARPMYGLTRWP